MCVHPRFADKLIRKGNNSSFAHASSHMDALQHVHTALLTSKTHCEVPNFCGSLREAKVPVSIVRLSIKIISPACAGHGQRPHQQRPKARHEQNTVNSAAAERRGRREEKSERPGRTSRTYSALQRSRAQVSEATQ